MNRTDIIDGQKKELLKYYGEKHSPSHTQIHEQYFLKMSQSKSSTVWLMVISVQETAHQESDKIDKFLKYNSHIAHTKWKVIRTNVIKAVGF